MTAGPPAQWRTPGEPAVTVAEGTRSDLLAVVAATGLPGSMLPRPTTPLPDDVFDQLVADCTGRAGMGLAGLLHEAVRTGALPATDAQHHRAEAAGRAAADSSGRVDAVLREVAARSRDSDTPVLVLGDLATAHLDYPEPDLRPYHDLCLLARPEGPTVEDVLLQMGYRRSGRHVRPDFARSYSDSIRYRRPGDPEVFAHRSLVDGPYGVRVSNERLWSSRTPLPAGDGGLVSLEAELRLLHLSFSVVLGGHGSVAHLRDLAQLALDGGLDVDRLRDLAQAWECRAEVALAVSRAWETLAIADVLAISRWAGRYVLTDEERRLLELYRVRGRSYTARGLATLSELPGVRPKLRFAWSLGMPEQSFLEERQTTRSGWILHGLGQVLRGVRGRGPRSTDASPASASPAPTGGASATLPGHGTQDPQASDAGSERVGDDAQP